MIDSCVSHSYLTSTWVIFIENIDESLANFIMINWVFRRKRLCLYYETPSQNLNNRVMKYVIKRRTEVTSVENGHPSQSRSPNDRKLFLFFAVSLGNTIYLYNAIPCIHVLYFLFYLKYIWFLFLLVFFISQRRLSTADILFTLVHNRSL